MKKQDDHLFKIGEIAKILGITRKTILVYEDMGLLTPAVKDENSGYRYYTADNMTQIRSIRSLQTLGLSLSEIKEYYYDSKNLDHHLERLMDLRAALDRNIQLLQVRAAKPGDLSIHRVRLPKQVCYCRRYQCKDTKDAADKLRDTYIAAARTGKILSSWAFRPQANRVRLITSARTSASNRFVLFICVLLLLLKMQSFQSGGRRAAATGSPDRRWK